MRVAALIILSLMAVPATAQQVCPSNPKPSGAREARLCWINAYKDVNGNKLPSTGPYSLVQTRIQRHKVGKNAACNFDTVDQTVNLPPSTLTRLYTELTDGKHCWRVRHISHDAKGNELYGAWSKTVSKVIPAPKTATAVEAPVAAPAAELVVY